MNAEASAALILRAINPQQLIDEACMSRQHGVPPPPGDDLRCVDYMRHSDQYDSGQDALDAWNMGHVAEEHRLSNEYPCQEVLDEAQTHFLTIIAGSWGIYEPGQLFDHLDYIQEHIGATPPKLQEKWNLEFIALFGKQKTFAEFTTEEASWLRQRLASYIATSPKVRRKHRDRPKRSKRPAKRHHIPKRH